MILADAIPSRFHTNHFEMQMAECHDLKKKHYGSRILEVLLFSMKIYGESLK